MDNKTILKIDMRDTEGDYGKRRAPTTFHFERMPFSARVKDGQLQFPSPGAAMRFQEWKREHDGANLTIEEIRPERSTSQLRLYRAWLRALCAQTGNDEEALHNWLLKQCAPKIVVKIKGPKGEVEDVQDMCAASTTAGRE